MSVELDTQVTKAFQIALFRLITGEDVVTLFAEEKLYERYLWMHPLKLIIRRLTTGAVGIILIPWLPEEIIQQENMMTCHILKRDVLTVLPVRNAMQDFYMTVRQMIIERILRNNERLDNNLYDMAKMYVEDITNPGLQEFKDQFDMMNDDEGITYH